MLQSGTVVDGFLFINDAIYNNSVAFLDMALKSKHQKSLRLGDAVAFIAQPIAKAIDTVAGTNVQGCGGCKKRQEMLNRITL